MDWDGASRSCVTLGRDGRQLGDEVEIFLERLERTDARGVSFSYYGRGQPGMISSISRIRRIVSFRATTIFW